MRITSIELENFRSFKSPQKIILAPVTLLFGPNSVGKSSILMAMAYVRQILGYGHCDPQHLEALGRKGIGGFRALVYGQDTARSIRIRLDFESGKTPFAYYDAEVSDMLNHVQASVVHMDDFGGSIIHGAVELEISWSEQYQWAYVSGYRVWINGGYIGYIHSSEDKKNTVIRELNTRHELLLPIDHEHLLDPELGPVEQDVFYTEFERMLSDLNPNSLSAVSMADVERAGQDFINRVAPIALHCKWGAIPQLGQPVNTNLLGQEFDEADQHLNYLTARQVLSQAFVLPLDKVLNCLENTIQIGPLRLVPDSDYMPNAHPTQADWVDGAAAWDLLHKNPERQVEISTLLKETNEWLVNPNKFNTGYQLVNGSLSQILGDHAASAPEVERLLQKRNLWFVDKLTGMKLSANQLGTGVSQVLPIIVASHYAPATMVTVEQPELHIHPRFQVELADLFISTCDRHSYLIETHSEHLILRLLRRVRELHENSNCLGLTPDQISVTYLMTSSEGVIVKRLDITPDGDFEQKWPGGFFDERDEELF
ncbi:AAA ATPase domain-containing protein [Pseudomonas syringae]|uniref:AAA family ATPase n=1 Tax=Pseudomonas syringae TaxID=317 RepID=UPI0008EA0FC8|nr:AAA family ATPase [Pseudomonas syringae]RMM55438.1 AAA ATPase domain protein [Pseudomonas syringae pv. atrofaciens]SFG74460.1 AAA ATPase domain-containing protein [Pseudomonas syringae]